MKTFAELFKKYRLRAEFESFAAFGNALSEKGLHYEDSIFSHWQKGARVPNNRHLLLKILEIFIERNAITSVQEANELLASAGQGYLTENEKEQLSVGKLSDSPFQVPSEIANFTGREKIIATIQKEITHGEVFLLHGPAGVGKTALAIKLGHLLRNKFPDGVLWYKVDSSNAMDILLSIARLFGEDISSIKDVTVRGSIVRTLLAQKQVLLIFDNVQQQDSLSVLLPNSSSCSVIFSSQEHSLNLSSDYHALALHAFLEQEVLSLFEKVFDKEYVVKNKKLILQINEKLGNLPLAVHIVATHINKFDVSLESYLAQLTEESLDLRMLHYEDKNLSRAIRISFDTLDSRAQAVFISLGVFEGKDFSLEAVCFINKLSQQEGEKVLHQLLGISLIENSKNKRYRIHPMMRSFARQQMPDGSLYLQAAFYYERLLARAEESRSYKILLDEVENIIFIFRKCYEYGYWDEVITLWNPIEKFLTDTNEVKKLRILMKSIDTAPNINKFQNILTAFMVLLLIYWIILAFSGLKTNFWNYFYSFLFGLIPFLGGLVGIIFSKSWKFFRSNIGKAIFFISAGLLSWGSGSMIWFFYYNFSQSIAVPYPSFADLGYFPAYFLWILGIFYLSRATGAKLHLKQKRNKLFLLVIPFIITTISYYFLLFIIKRTFLSETPLRLFLDLYYPSMDIIILTLAIIIFGLSANFFKGKYKLSIFAILCGFVFQYFADFIFSYTISLNTYFNGNFGDLIFTCALYLLTWGMLSFYLTPKRKE